MIETTSDGATWARWCDEVGLRDVYYDWSHLEIWAREWAVAPVGVRFADAEGTVLCCLLRDDLAGLPGGPGHCDLRTAYDFGGPLVARGDPVATLRRFQPAWDALLAEWGVVTEFQRLHPFLHAARPAGAVHHADNLLVDLGRGYDAARGGYYGSWRRDLNKAERAGLRVRVVDAPSDADVAVFAALYAGTMRRRDAPPWYRFSERTLGALLRHPSVSLVRVDTAHGEAAAAAISLRSGSTRFYHLSASDPAHRASFPNHALLDALIRHAADSGAERVHLGGGAPTLKRFKSRVANGTVPYFVVKRVVDPDAYTTLCEATGTPAEGGAFPGYLGYP